MPSSARVSNVLKQFLVHSQPRFLFPLLFYLSSSAVGIPGEYLAMFSWKCVLCESFSGSSFMFVMLLRNFSDLGEESEDECLLFRVSLSS